MEVRLHPQFQEWLGQLAETEPFDIVEWFEVYAEVMALIVALEQRGRELQDPECRPVVSDGYDLHSLRRTPPTATTPYADRPPVLRILFGYARDENRHEVAVIALGGDKTELGNAWYQANMTRAQDRIDQLCQHHPTYKPIIKRGGRR